MSDASRHARKTSPALLLGWLVSAIAPTAPARADDGLRNWFDDPFFRISSGIPDCPLPAGPFADEAERRVQAHHRAEKGISCWLARQCDRSNAFAYDQDIARALQAAVREQHPFADTSLWITVQARVVYIEGCANDAAVVPKIEAFARAVPQVQSAIAIVRTEASARPPYKLRHPQ